MVLPLVDEHKPKCFLCHEGFDDLEGLRAHQEAVHKGSPGSRQKETGPAPGDVTVF